ncbi:unnamed protein product [Adineta steineri]|uniref:JmjC domain-containing protein n=1 Tax=Adineta steineri TaxID=433720 RepID=A0A814SRP4_9BILA|nr:unnamed protein product [Adineta steineri]CAF3657141.1 unnamed protein product [Adineta steineri]
MKFDYKILGSKISSIIMDIPTLKISNDELQNFVSFVYKHEQLLKEYGAIKIQPNIDCKLGLKKQRKNLIFCPVAEQVVKINEDELIYSVQKINNMDETIPQNILATDESVFWSSLSCSDKNNNRRQTNISFLPKTSFFYRKISSAYFNIHNVPKQSLLKLGGKKMTRQVVPYVRRAHGSGAIFPLSSTQQRLFSVNYHHEGGAHHWYIIPTYERDVLQKAISPKNAPVCLDHGQLLVHPSILEKHHIRYHRIKQQPNEFVVLAAGTLAQSFSEGANWSESIDFALPGWIEEGRASAATSPCQCDISNNYSLNTIDITLFTHNLIEKYISSHLTNSTDNKSMTFEDISDIDMATVSTPNGTDDNSLDVHAVLARNAKLTIPISRLAPTSYEPPTPATTTSISCLFTDNKDKNTCDGNNINMDYELLAEGSFGDVTEWNTSDMISIDSFLLEYASELNTQNQLDQASKSTNIHGNTGNDYSMEADFLLFDAMMNLDIPNATTCVSTHTQANEHIEIFRNKSETHTNDPSTLSLDISATTISERNDHKKKRTLNQARNQHKALYVSALRNSVSIKDIRRHFTGCTEVTIKRHHTRPYLKYAVVCHRTPEEAEYNLKRPSNYCLLGSEYRVEYAIIRYDDEQQAASVVDQAKKYKINGQPLSISLYSSKN